MSTLVCRVTVNYGQLLILNAGDEYHVSLGWNGYPLTWGQFVVTGEPVAVMGGGAQSAVAKRAVQTNPYKDGIPVDPGPGWP
jgi:murein hydrolase activator